jgi:hypothetical protein
MKEEDSVFYLVSSLSSTHPPQSILPQQSSPPQILSQFNYWGMCEKKGTSTREMQQ